MLLLLAFAFKRVVKKVRSPRHLSFKQGADRQLFTIPS
jgi:hypothetical protein